MKKIVILTALYCFLSIISLHSDHGYAALNDQRYLILFKDSQLPDSYVELIRQAGGKVMSSLDKVGAVEVESNNTTFKEDMLQSTLVLHVGVENKLSPEEPDFIGTSLRGEFQVDTEVP